MTGQQIKERIEKAAAAEATQGTSTQGTSRGDLPAYSHGLVGNAFDRPKRDCLRDRVAQRRARAAAEGERASRLSELEYLLEKNPEVARILELLEDFER